MKVNATIYIKLLWELLQVSVPGSAHKPPHIPLAPFSLMMRKGRGRMEREATSTLEMVAISEETGSECRCSSEW